MAVPSAPPAYRALNRAERNCGVVEKSAVRANRCSALVVFDNPSAPPSILHAMEPQAMLGYSF